jgi:hypothetical protein
MTMTTGERQLERLETSVCDPVERTVKYLLKGTQT